MVAPPIIGAVIMSMRTTSNTAWEENYINQRQKQRLAGSTTEKNNAGDDCVVSVDCIICVMST